MGTEGEKNENERKVRKRMLEVEEKGGHGGGYRENDRE